MQRERIKAWVKHYNHKRPNQGIEGMCPADRYFEVASELRKTIEKGIAENILEMALRGKPKAPFYMVGRMEGQSVVLSAEKGKLKLSVDDAEGKNTQEATWDIKKGNDHEREEQRNEKETQSGSGVQRPGEVPGGAVNLDGKSETGRCVSGNESNLDAHQALAGSGAGGHDAVAGDAQRSGGGNGADTPIEGASGKTPGQRGGESAGTEAGQTPGDEQEEEREPITGSDHEPLDEARDKSQGINGAGTRHDDRAGPGWQDDGEGSRPDAGSLAPDLSRVGEAGVGGHDGGAHGSGTGTPLDCTGPGNAEASKASERVEQAGVRDGKDSGASSSCVGSGEVEGAD